MTIQFSRCFAMPNAATFSIKPIGEFVKRYLAVASVSVDPFARNRGWATYTNDINPATSAQSHQDAETFLAGLRGEKVNADLVLFDPPYSPRQVMEHYRAAGLPVTQEDTQSARLFRRVRDAIDPIVRPGGIVLSFGWQSAGMGIGRGYELIETMLVAHGGGHNDTICIAERKTSSLNSNDRSSQERGAHLPSCNPRDNHEKRNLAGSDPSCSRDHQGADRQAALRPPSAVSSKEGLTNG